MQNMVSLLVRTSIFYLGHEWELPVSQTRGLNLDSFCTRQGCDHYTMNMCVWWLKLKYFQQSAIWQKVSLLSSTYPFRLLAMWCMLNIYWLCPDPKTANFWPPSLRTHLNDCFISVSGLVMSASEPSTPKAKGTKAPAPPQPSDPTTTVVMRTNGSLDASRGHGRSVSVGAYNLKSSSAAADRHSAGVINTGAIEGERKKEKRSAASRNSSHSKKDVMMMMRQDASDSVSLLFTQLQSPDRLLKCMSDWVSLPTERGMSTRQIFIDYGAIFLCVDSFNWLHCSHYHISGYWPPLCWPLVCHFVDHFVALSLEIIMWELWCCINHSNSIDTNYIHPEQTSYFLINRPLRGDKVSILSHTYPHKPLRKIELTICNHQAHSPLYVWPNVWSGDLQFQKKYGHTWHRMSLLRPCVIKQH